MELNCSIFSHLIQFLYGNPHFYSSSYFIPPKTISPQTLMVTSSNYPVCTTSIRKPLESWWKHSWVTFFVPVSQCPSFSMKRINFPNRAAIASTSVTPHLNSKSSFWNELQELLCDIHHIVLTIRKPKSHPIKWNNFIFSPSLQGHTKQLTLAW